jgi:protein TonB
VTQVATRLRLLPHAPATTTPKAAVTPDPGWRRCRAIKYVYKGESAVPPEARQARIEGVVILSVVIAKDGTISDIKVISASDPRLLPGVLDAVKQWVYKPTLLNGEPVEVITTVTVNFSLAQ